MSFNRTDLVLLMLKRLHEYCSFLQASLIVAAMGWKDAFGEDLSSGQLEGNENSHRVAPTTLVELTMVRSALGSVSPYTLPLF